MTDELQPASQPPSQPSQPVIPPGLPPFHFPEPRKTNKTPWIILGIVAAMSCLTVIICVAIGAFSARNSFSQQAGPDTVVDAFMKAMDAKDIGGAYALFSPRAQRQMPQSKLEELLNGKNYALFKGYQSVTVFRTNLTIKADADQNKPQGTVASISGTISYEGSFTGQFQAVLEKVGQEWRLFYINVTAPPDKFNS